MTRAPSAFAMLLAFAMPALAETAPEPSARPIAVAPAVSAPEPHHRVSRPRPRGLPALHVPRLGPAADPRPARGEPVAAVEPARARGQAGNGPLCGDPRLTGAYLPEIRGRGGCGIRLPVRITKVAGVTLKPTATLNCDAARALAEWVEDVAQPAAVQAGGGLAGMDVPAGYVCRTVNHRPGGSLSEHARGAAIDISAFHFSDGRTVSVEQGWTGSDAGFLRALWDGACGPFGTVLGPEADRWHLDHFHFDVKHRRSGPVCR